MVLTERRVHLYQNTDGEYTCTRTWTLIRSAMARTLHVLEHEHAQIVRERFVPLPATP